MGDGDEATPYLVEKGNEHFKNIQTLATKHKVYLLGGSAATREDGKIYNRSYNFDPLGNLIAQYDKIHLFSLNLGQKAKKIAIDEASIYSKGNSLQTLKVGEFNLGLSICFDIRFPEMYRKYSDLGVNVLSISSAFTVPTGKAHWHTLIRARAIENQAYVVASAQWGEHNSKIQTYGHSIVVDPWGKVVADCGEGEKFIICDISMKKVDQVRQRMNIN